MRAPLFRIEVAASEVLGGPAVAWVDPNQVIGLVARGEPGSFLRTALLPRFQRLESGVDADAESAGGALPPLVSAIAAAMQEVHDLLWRENQLGNAAWAEALAIARVGDKINLLSAGECAAQSVVQGRVYPMAPSAAGSAGLGRGVKARIEITSMEASGGQRIVLTAAGARPDELAIAQLFGERLDLQRACDGLLPLTAGQDGGAGIVALSFVPIATSEQRLPAGLFSKEIVEELATALAEGALEIDARPFAAGGAPEDVEEREREAAAAECAPEGARPPATPRAPKSEATPRAAVPYRVPPEEIPEPASNIVSFLETLETQNPPAARTPIETLAPTVPPSKLRRRPLVEARKPRPLPLAIGMLAGVIGIGAVLFALAGPAPMGVGGKWRQMMRVLGGGKVAGANPETYLAVRSEPDGAAVSIDGKTLAAKTPCAPLAVAPGTHRVKVELAGLGVWDRTVEVKKGSGLHLNARFTGDLRVSLTDTTRAVELTLDGRRIGRAPLVVHDLPVGEHRLEAFGTGLGPWKRPVTVTTMDTARVIVDRPGEEAYAVVAVSTSMLGEGGYTPSRGEEVFVDRQAIGSAPVEDELEPGLHSVRVEHRGEPPWIEIIDVRAGGSYYVRAEFGVDRDLRIAHFPQEPLSSEGPLIVSAAIDGDPEEVTLYFVEGGGIDRGAIPMTRIKPGDPLFVAALPRGALESGSVRYYIRARDRLSQDCYSEVYDINVEEPARTARR